MERKDTSLTFRISSRYKSYLEEMAKAEGLTTGQFLNNYIRLSTEGLIHKQARIKAHEVAATKMDIPFKMVANIETAQDWDDFRSLVGEKRGKQYYEFWAVALDDAIDQISAEKDFQDWDTEKSISLSEN
jgi:uncharacterized protein (DUF1778 family)